MGWATRGHGIGLLLLLALPTLGRAAPAAPPEYRLTTLAWTAAGDLAVVVKELKPRRPAAQKLLIYPSGSLASAPREVPLGAATKPRPVLALWADTERMIIVTQLQDAQGDNPDIQAYDFKKRRWADVAYVSCAKVFALRLGPANLEFECEPFPGEKSHGAGRPLRKVKHHLPLGLPEGASVDLGVFRDRAEREGAVARIDSPAGQPQALAVVPLGGTEARLEAAKVWEGTPQ